MKKLFLLFIFPLLLSGKISHHISAENVWHYNLDTAKKLAQQKDKNILVYFTGSDWCPPCKMLKKDFFDTTEFSEAATNYVLVYIDMPRNKNILSSEQLEHNKKLTTEYNRKGIFPLIKVLNNQGKSLDEHSGYSMNGDTRRHLWLLKKYGE